MCLGTIISGHNRVWAQICLGTNVSGHKRVLAQSCGPNYVWAQTWWNHNLVFQRKLALIGYTELWYIIHIPHKHNTLERYLIVPDNNDLWPGVDIRINEIHFLRNDMLGKDSNILNIRISTIKWCCTYKLLYTSRLQNTFYPLWWQILRNQSLSLSKFMLR